MFLFGLLTFFLIKPSESEKSVKSPGKPIVLVPGVFGSQVEGWYEKGSAPHIYCSKNSKGWTTLWLCIECMLPPVLSCWVDNIKLNVSDVKNIRNRDGVQTKVNDWGYTDGIDYLDKNKYVIQYAKMVKGLAELPGYERGVNIRGAPYDFRYPPNSEVGQRYMTALKYLVQETYENNNNTRVVVLAHSMGNPYVVNFFRQMTQEWKDKYVDSYIAIAGVFGGSAKAIRTLTSGETEGVPDIVLDPLMMREVERTVPTVYWLMPPPQLWGDTPFVFAQGRNFSAEQYHEMMRGQGNAKGVEVYDTITDTPLFHPDLGVDVYCIHGANNSTPFQFRYDASYPDKDPLTVNGPGDGTVNKRSLELCKQFKRLKDYKVVSGTLSTHLEILQRDDIIAYVADYLVGHPAAHDTLDF